MWRNDDNVTPDRINTEIESWINGIVGFVLHQWGDAEWIPTFDMEYHEVVDDWRYLGNLTLNPRTWGLAGGGEPEGVV